LYFENQHCNPLQALAAFHAAEAERLELKTIF